MYNNDTELMFPLRVIPQISDMRGELWKELTERIYAEDSRLEEKAAFTLLMVKLSGCQGCSVDSFRGMRGCTSCVKQTVRRYRSSDEEFLNQFQAIVQEVERFLNSSKNG